MRQIFVFNGDADGLCALQQLRLAEGDAPAGFITGPKRRTELVKEVCVEDARNLKVTVLDLSFRANAASEADMFFRPLDLYKRLSVYPDPSGFVREDRAFGVLWTGYMEDMQHVAGLNAFAANDDAAVYVLPDAAWARRVTGVFANSLTHQAPRRAHAVVADNGKGGLAVSVRAPLARPAGAAALCLLYPTGGGRESAAGINHLPADEFEAFAQRFIEHFGG
jgi:hypothetical protein